MNNYWNKITTKLFIYNVKESLCLEENVTMFHHKKKNSVFTNIYTNIHVLY